MKNILYVILGGSIGATLRYLTGLVLQKLPINGFPIGTITVNLVGCLILGMLITAGQHHTTIPEGPYLMLTVGLCGSFTTFSTFTADTIRLADNGQWFTALAYIVLSVVGGFVLFLIGRRMCM